MKGAYIAILAAAIPAAAWAQSAVDAQQISQPDLRGTARFMSMGGAFTALGGDLSTLNQNPAGVGVYRNSDVGVTIDINMQSTKTDPNGFFPYKNTQTKVACNNFGYVGATRLDGALRTFNWGVSYGRAASFNRVYRGYVPQTETSQTNYIAAFTTASGATPEDLDFGNNYNPYLDSGEDWLSILAYSSFLINGNDAGGFNGLYDHETSGDALYYVNEQGYVDEYNITFGGNVSDVVYWGLGFGITDLNYTRSIYYDESMGNAWIPAFDNGGSQAGMTNGSAGYDLSTWKHINGTGWNIKLGLIIKPINEFRLGFAVHTPTWYHLTQQYNGEVSAEFTPTDYDGNALGGRQTFNEYTDDAYFNWRYKAPWKLMVGAAGVIGGRAILSLDYEYDAYGDMSISTPIYVNGFDTGFEANDALNQDIKNYYKSSSIVRLGAEFRVTPQLSLRAGYNTQTSNSTAEAQSGVVQVSTSGVDTSYSLDKSTYYVTAGIGYRYQAWYFDVAYVYKHRESTFHAYTDFDGFLAPTSRLTDANSSIVLSTGFKF